MPGHHRSRELRDDTLIVTHTVDDSHSGWRADRFLKTQYAHFSRAKLQSLIDEGRITIAGKRLKASTTVYAGEKLIVATACTKLEEPPVCFDTPVLYEDDEVLVIDKPGNLPVHPAGRYLFNTLLMKLRRERAAEFYMIHRLDRETSGVIVIGKSSQAASWLVRQFRERQTEKKYYAITQGHLSQPSIEVDAEIGSAIQSHVRLKMQAFPKGSGQMSALTKFRVVRSSAKYDLVDCELMTGRQHQIRVHLDYIGHPVVGDKLYGRPEEVFLDFIERRKLDSETARELGIDRHALHSRYLKFYHHTQKRWIEIESPLPKDMCKLLEES